MVLSPHTALFAISTVWGQRWNQPIVCTDFSPTTKSVGLRQMDHDLTPTLHHPKNGWSFFLHRASSTFPFASASTTLAALVLHHLWLSLMASNHIGFVTLHLVG